MTNSVKQFAAAAEEAPREDSLDHVLSFGVAGVEYTARLPTKSEVALWMVATGNSTRVGYDETIRFLAAVLHDSTYDNDEGDLLRDDDGSLSGDVPQDFDPDAQLNALYKRWRNPKDKLEVDDWIPVVMWMIEEASKFPTTSSSDSSSGRPASGRSSTRATPAKASTRSRSTRAASAG